MTIIGHGLVSSTLILKLSGPHQWSECHQVGSTGYKFQILNANCNEMRAFILSWSSISQMFSGQVLSIMQRWYDPKSKFVCKFATKNRWISVKIEEMITDLNLKVWTMDKDGCVHDLQVSLKSLQHNNLCILPIRGWTLLLFISSAQREELDFTSNVSAQQPIICCPGSPEGDLHHKMESNRSRDTESQHEFGERAHLNKFFHACHW